MAVGSENMSIVGHKLLNCEIVSILTNNDSRYQSREQQIHKLLQMTGINGSRRIEEMQIRHVNNLFLQYLGQSKSIKIGIERDEKAYIYACKELEHM